jgi:hypothetical protein
LAWLLCLCLQGCRRACFFLPLLCLAPLCLCSPLARSSRPRPVLSCPVLCAAQRQRQQQQQQQQQQQHATDGHTRTHRGGHTHTHKHTCVHSCVRMWVVRRRCFLPPCRLCSSGAQCSGAARRRRHGSSGAAWTAGVQETHVRRVMMRWSVAFETDHLPFPSPSPLHA